MLLLLILLLILLLDSFKTMSPNAKAPTHLLILLQVGRFWARQPPQPLLAAQWHYLLRLRLLPRARGRRATASGRGPLLLYRLPLLLLLVCRWLLLHSLLLPRLLLGLLLLMVLASLQLPMLLLPSRPVITLLLSWDHRTLLLLSLMFGC